MSNVYTPDCECGYIGYQVGPATFHYQAQVPSGILLKDYPKPLYGRALVELTLRCPGCGKEVTKSVVIDSPMDFSDGETTNLNKKFAIAEAEQILRGIH